MYKTLISFEVLSEEPIPEAMELDTIIYEGYDGAYVIGFENRKQIALSKELMRNALRAFGSDPSFFMLEKED